MGCCLFDCIGGFVLTIFRWALFLFNLIFLVAGLALIVLGSVILVNLSTLDDFYSDQTEIGAIVLISAGCLTFLVSFLGCWGAIKRVPCMMNTYAVMLFVIFAVQLTGGILAFVYRDYFQTELKDSMTTLMDTYLVDGQGGDQNAKDAWDTLQTEYECCGITEIADWTLIRPELNGIPKSCNCTMNTEGCSPYMGVVNYYYDTGCYTKLEPMLTELVDAIGGIGIGVALLELVAGVFSLCLANRFSDKRRRSSGSS